MDNRNQNLNIVLIDDDEVDEMAVERALARLNNDYTLKMAGNGIEGLKLLRSGRVNQPRIVLLDLNMPRMNGIDFLRELRQDPDLQEEAVYVLTTSGAEEDRQATASLNVRRYMLKENLQQELADLLISLLVA